MHGAGASDSARQHTAQAGVFTSMDTAGARGCMVVGVGISLSTETAADRAGASGCSPSIAVGGRASLAAGGRASLAVKGRALLAAGAASNSARRRSGQRKAPGAENVSESGQAGGKRGQRKAPAGLRGDNARRRR
eukprot:3817057-Pleurochrysis_carterae.AAC.1